MLSLGDALGKSLSEIRLLPSSELTLWVEYFKIKNAPPKEETPKSDLDKFKKVMGQ